MSGFVDQIDQKSAGIRLCRINKRGDLILYDPVAFERGREAVDTILRRASICGRVEINGDLSATDDHFADLMDAECETSFETVALDPGSWRYLKDKLRPAVWRPKLTPADRIEK